MQIKAEHERQVVENRNYPSLREELKKLVQKYDGSPDLFHYSVPEIVTNHSQEKFVRVDASREGGINTGIKVTPAERTVLFARGLISFDGGHTFATPEGILCNELGMPMLVAEGDTARGPVIFPHPNAHKTDGGKSGLVGSLYGWIDTYSEAGAFFIGSRREIDITNEGILYLAVNDARDTYGDNDGEFRVDIRIIKPEQVGKRRD